MANGSRIPTGLARQLAKNYKEQKLGRQILVDDSRAVWFSREILLEALGIVPPPTSSISGIRFYFGAYENRTDYPKDHRYTRMLTLVLVQTENATGPDGKPYHKDLLEDPDAVPAYPTPFREFNDGQICPPPNCDSDGLLRNV